MSGFDSGKNKKSGASIDTLKSTTMLSGRRFSFQMPASVIRKLRDAVYPTQLNPHLNKISNPYQAAKVRFNDLWSLKKTEPFAAEGEEENPLTKLTTLRGAMASYWTGESLKQSLKPTLGLVSLVSLSSVSTTIMLQTYAETLSAIFNDGNALLGAGKFGTAALVGYFSNKGMMHYRDKIQEGMALSLREQFSDFIGDNPEIVDLIRQKDTEVVDMDTSSPLHALGKSPEDFSANFVDVGTRSFASVTMASALIYGIAQNSMNVPMLGDYGTLYLSLMTVGAYSAFTYKIGSKLGQDAALSLEKKKKVESSNEERLAKIFDVDSKVKSEDCAAIIKENNKKVNQATIENNLKDRNYANFMQATGAGGFFVTPISALASLPWGSGGVLSAMAQETFLATHAQTQFLHSTVTQVIDLFASRGRVTVPGKVMSDLAREFIEAKVSEQEKEIDVYSDSSTKNEAALKAELTIK